VYTHLNLVYFFTPIYVMSVLVTNYTSFAIITDSFSMIVSFVYIVVLFVSLYYNGILLSYVPICYSARFPTRWKFHIKL
jgi:hypothetical protein